ncbi:MAG TPA: cysteine--tRNA ligase [Beijerinckiaceae bacterium]|jgi:cysteinyl-tRNA synthetase
MDSAKSMDSSAADRIQPDAPASRLRLFDSLTRKMKEFVPLRPGVAHVYSCGPTVYSYQHIGNMRAYIFTDTLSRTLSRNGFAVTHIINITDVGHLISDADTGDDKLERASRQEGRSALEIARYYTDVFWRDIASLNIKPPARWPFATDHIDDMIAFAGKIVPAHCYLLDSGLYFDTSTVPDYGSLARAETGELRGRIDEIPGKRNPGDFAVWRLSQPGVAKQMEWDSPWGRGAPGWHLECSVMSMKYLGEPFDIHTGGIDHREIHHPNEIAQNQAYTCSCRSGANIWMHNNFLIDRDGKLSKSAGGALLLSDLVERGYHPMAFRLACLQAHYRRPLEFTFANLAGALSRLKRIVMALERLRRRAPAGPTAPAQAGAALLERFDAEMADDLMTPRALPILEEALAREDIDPGERLATVDRMDEVLGLRLGTLSRDELRIRPAAAAMQEDEVESVMAARAEARARKDFAEADRLRSVLETAGVAILDGDPLGWEWRLAG